MGEQDHDVFYDGPEPPADEQATGDKDVPTDPGSAVDLLVDTLFAAGPEAGEHLLRAAQELLLAAKAVVDAGERVLDEARARHEAGAPEPGAGDDAPTGRVRRIDLAE